MAQPLPTLAVDYTEGDTLPQLTGVVRMDLTGATVTLTLDRPTTPLTKTAVLDDPANGAFHFAFGSTDLVGGIGQEALVRVTTSGADVLTLAHFQIDVNEAIA